MSYSNTPEATPVSNMQRTPSNLSEILQGVFAVSTPRNLYLLCVHCTNGVCVEYTNKVKLSNLLGSVNTNLWSISNINTKESLLVLTSCRTCMHYQVSFIEDDPDLSRVASNNEDRVMKLCLHESFATSSKIYKAIIKRDDMLPTVVCYDYGLVHIDCRPLFEKLTEQCKLISYIEEKNEFITGLCGGFF